MFHLLQPALEVSFRSPKRGDLLLVALFCPCSRSSLRLEFPRASRKSALDETQTRAHLLLAFTTGIVPRRTASPAEGGLHAFSNRAPAMEAVVLRAATGDLNSWCGPVFPLKGQRSSTRNAYQVTRGSCLRMQLTPCPHGGRVRRPPIISSGSGAGLTCRFCPLCVPIAPGQPRVGVPKPRPSPRQRRGVPSASRCTRGGAIGHLATKSSGKL